MGAGRTQGGYNPYNQGHTVDVPLTVVAEAHSSGDSIGALMTVTVDLGKAWKGCELRAVSIFDNGNKANASTLYIFREEPSAFADGDAWVMPVADLKMMPPGHKGIAIITSDWEDFATSDESTISVAVKAITEGGGLDLRNGTPSTFYARLIDNTGFTPAAVDDWSVLFHFWID